MKKAHNSDIASDEEPQLDKKLPIVKKKQKSDAETRVTCDICYKTFKNFDNLVRHMEAHRGIKSKQFNFYDIAISFSFLFS